MGRVSPRGGAGGAYFWGVREGGGGFNTTINKEWRLTVRAVGLNASNVSKNENGY